MERRRNDCVHSLGSRKGGGGHVIHQTPTAPPYKPEPYRRKSQGTKEREKATKKRYWYHILVTTAAARRPLTFVQVKLLFVVVVVFFSSLTLFLLAAPSLYTDSHGTDNASREFSHVGWIMEACVKMTAWSSKFLHISRYMRRTIDVKNKYICFEVCMYMVAKTDTLVQQKRDICLKIYHGLPDTQTQPSFTSSCGLSPNIMLNATLALGMSAMSGGIPISKTK